MLPGVGWALRDRKEFPKKSRGEGLSILSHTPVPWPQQFPRSECPSFL